jgi:hypothetical protein
MYWGYFGFADPIAPSCPPTVALALLVRISLHRQNVNLLDQEGKPKHPSCPPDTHVLQNNIILSGFVGRCEMLDHVHRKGGYDLRDKDIECGHACPTKPITRSRNSRVK